MPFYRCHTPLNYALFGKGSLYPERIANLLTHPSVEKRVVQHKIHWEGTNNPRHTCDENIFHDKVEKLSKFLSSLQLLLPFKIYSRLLTPRCTQNHVVLPIPRNSAMTVKLNTIIIIIPSAPAHPDFHHFWSRFGYTGNQRVVTVFSKNEIELLHLLCWRRIAVLTESLKF